MKKNIAIFWICVVFLLVGAFTVNGSISSSSQSTIGELSLKYKKIVENARNSILKLKISKKGLLSKINNASKIRTPRQLKYMEKVDELIKASDQLEEILNEVLEVASSRIYSDQKKDDFILEKIIEVNQIRKEVSNILVQILDI